MFFLHAHVPTYSGVLYAMQMYSENEKTQDDLMSETVSSYYATSKESDMVGHGD